MSGSELTEREISRIPLLEIPRRFTFSEVAHARHNSSNLILHSLTRNIVSVGNDIAGSASILLLEMTDKMVCVEIIWPLCLVNEKKTIPLQL